MSCLKKLPIYFMFNLFMLANSNSYYFRDAVSLALNLQVVQLCNKYRQVPCEKPFISLLIISQVCNRHLYLFPRVGRFRPFRQFRNSTSGVRKSQVQKDTRYPVFLNQKKITWGPKINEKETSYMVENTHKIKLKIKSFFDFFMPQNGY